MKENEIITKWKRGLSKNQLATMYRRQYNQEIKIIRSSVRHRHDGRYISNYEALAYVERAIYKYLKERKNK
ncbi:unknown [Clostridium sp. CAG:343]|nr:unknown [Clostridium sp. CAG:343]